MNLQTVRWSQVERLNGSLSTWWHYNRITLAVLLTVIAALLASVEIERGLRARAETDAATIARNATKDSFLCYAHDRATSLTIAGGSHQQVYDALYAAEQEFLDVRAAYLIAKARDTTKAPH